MPHEIFLTMVVLAMWMFILRHFFVIYSRVTFVNPLSYGQYLLKDKSLGSKTSTTSGTSKNSRKSLRERSISGLPPSEHKFSLLEDAVHAWRSETVLSKVELVDGMEVTRRFELDRVSVKSDSRQRKVSQPVNDRASFTSTNEATQRRAFHHSSAQRVRLPQQNDDQPSGVLTHAARRTAAPLKKCRSLERNRQRRKKKMEIVREIEETREINTDCENTYSQRPLLLSVALQKNQVSLDSQDSYATAHELVSISDTLDL
ncbi:unnamed protein product [Toxocara canis]|uniref:DUF4408 domain-containing protein n=1 Tax=Toxocara canis TaxID=6265 RepID=A0A183UKE4_TOXCA|nr:unnamed protein product [Toxocara canis]